MGTAEDYFRYARDKAFIDIVGHQGNDFQITDAFWNELNELTSCSTARQLRRLPGYDWPGNTGMGGDRNIFFVAKDGRSAAPRTSSSRVRRRPKRSTRDELFRAPTTKNAASSRMSWGATRT